MRHTRLWLILAGFLVACGTATTPVTPVEDTSDDAQDADSAIADSEVTCSPITDTACCLNGVLTGTPCWDFATGAKWCPNGGFACSTMGGSSSCKQVCGADVADTTDTPDTTDTGVEAYAPVAATLPVETTGCDATFALTPLVSTTRPSSGAPCYIGTNYADGVGLPCLPWEWCDKGMIAPPFSPPEKRKVTGSLTCMRPCETSDGPCPAGTSCVPHAVMGGDMIGNHQICDGTTGGPWPTYKKDTAYPAEGGLACWTSLAKLSVYAYPPHLARVGPHVYVLTADAGSDAMLWHAPLAAPSEATMTVVLEEQGNVPEWTGLASSGDYLVAYQRKVPTLGQQPSGSPWLVLAGKPDASGAVTLTPTGLEIPMPKEPAFNVPGTQHACLGRLDGTQVLLSCVQVDAQGKASLKETPLNFPPELVTRIACYNGMVGTQTLVPLGSIAVGGGLIGILAGPCEFPDPTILYTAFYNSDTDTVLSAFDPSPLPITLAMGTPFLLYQHTFLANGWSARFAPKLGFGPWYGTTLHPGHGTPILADDVVLAVASKGWGPGLSDARLWANRVLW